MNKAAAVAGGAVILFTGALLAYGTSRKSQQSPSDVVNGQQNSSGANASSNSGFNQTAPSPFEFSWVDGNDRAGSQTVEIAAGLADAGSLTYNVTDITWQKGVNHTFKVNGGLMDTRSYAMLSRWGFAWNLFDPDGKVMKSGSGVTGSDGAIAFTFDFTPPKDGVYRIRVAAGDAADEDAIVFNLPAGQTLHGLFGD